MTTLTLELPRDLYDRLHAEAERQGKLAEDVARQWLAERLPAPTPAPPPASDREQVRAVLRAAGLLVEPTPEERARAAAVTVTLEEVRAALDRAGGRPLSEIVLEQRGPKG
ncbi:MAG: hypothetical protein ACTHMJ_03880 [Thermomicrobiales bacterium]|jgi:hypothetical protein